MKWTKFLCETDSDNDGKTNGEELGDPNCVWTKGDIPAVTKHISHPGVCTPYSAPACQSVNSWIDCQIEDLKCDALTEVAFGHLWSKGMTLRIPQTAVPPDQTTIFCTYFDLPSEEDYHFVAMEPHIDNANVMHHMLLFACENLDAVPKDITKPHPCGVMAIVNVCETLIMAWGFGSSGVCMDKNAGLRIGRNGIKKVVLQIHWNNPELRSDYTDSSGMKLYYTPNLRQNDLKFWQIGAVHSEIPPGEEEVDVVTWCRSECTSRYLSGPIYITKVSDHMHYLGRKQRIQHFRNGVLLRDILNDESYAYDKFVEYSPGDEIKGTCTYRTVGKDRTTFIGEGTEDEMCVGFLYVFPAENLDKNSCYAAQDIDMCKISDFPSDFPLVNGCNLKQMANPFNKEYVALFKNLKRLCKPFDMCTKECKQYVRGVLEKNKCFQGSFGSFYRRVSIGVSSHFLEVWAAIDSCKLEIEVDDCQERCDSGTNSRTIELG